MYSMIIFKFMFRASEVVNCKFRKRHLWVNISVDPDQPNWKPPRAIFLERPVGFIVNANTKF